METILSLQNVTHYFGGLRAVNNFSIDLPEGSLWGLIGPNGAGKTTIFNLITGVYKPTEGKILFEGNNITGLKSHTVVDKGIARTFQNLRIFNELTVVDNIRVAKHFKANYKIIDSILRTKKFYDEERRIKEETYDLLKIFGLQGRMNNLAKHLPYGELRKLEIARALATKPKLLLLDEPAAGMNPREVVSLMELIHSMRDTFKVTILLVEHQMKVVMGICERIKVMDFGESITEGNPEEIRSNKKVIEAYLGSEGGKC
ncbi:MAG TPA: ABC transporter ATP-binding protein [Caldisericia bacterium]|nr:ABC transporter ATP-binding protein [Caldisericia bacterium]HQL66497.1 ABC transporter ATP-binding protein [Caldisericia bacterium]HQN48077.1 ABC transporter ATP-binding protein [Caldisericia bacterium]HQO99867.1 ABC transporter ATP-binding protein [Caldisericia bacterium]